MFTTGHFLAFAAAAIAAIGGGAGSSIAVAKAGQAAAGVIAEAPERQRKLVVFQLLPATQAIYGLLVSFLILNAVGALSGTMNPVSIDQGWAFIVAAMPISVVGYLSAIYQGKAAVAAINLAGKRPEVNGITLVAVVETFAIFALLISALMVLLGIKL